MNRSTRRTVQAKALEVGPEHATVSEPLSVPAGKTKPARLPLDYITLDPRLQSRQLKPSVVKDYLGVRRRGGEFPPVLVVHDTDDNYYLVDGNHRVAAERQLVGIEDIAVEIVDGTFDDAMWLSWGANRSHGLRRTRREKHDAIRAAVLHPRWRLESDRAIGQHIGCDHKTVGAVRRECAGGEFPTDTIAPRSHRPSGPSKPKILEACRLLAKLKPERARQFDRTELAIVRAAYESMHRLLFGGSTLTPEKPSASKDIVLN
jgi:ParB-like nuclease domain